MFNNLRGVICFISYIVNTIIWATPIIIGSVFKLIPIKFSQTLLTYLLDACASAWVSGNTLIQRLSRCTQLNVEGLETLSTKEWYMVLANHQSWVDILVLQRVFNHKIPFLKFFLKKELIWVPILGLCWWALDFPFMQRFSRAFIEKNPHLKGKDLATTQKACEKFRFKPVSIMNFVEGTRFTPAKHAKQQSPYQNLLNPRAGGIAFVLNSMGDQLHKLLNVTIHYPQGNPSFWAFICGKVQQINVRVQVLEIDKQLLGDYFNNDEHKARFQQWLNQLWLEKDQQLNQLAISNKKS
ncbi:acyltransferase [Alteromonadaceae bacterium BrNp21-10]|nr:acyltransferase [Alteromonadaceae bacterium BrNp21-10]